MKIQTRFFITFFCFALFFSFSAYLTQDSLLRRSQTEENMKVEQHIETIQSKINVDEHQLNKYLKENSVGLDVISYKNGYINHFVYNNNFNDVALSAVDNYKSKKDILESCKNINSLENGVKREQTSYENNYIIQSFCKNDVIYIVTSNYFHYEPTIMLLRQSYLLILIATLLITAVLAFFLSRYVSNPIKKINYFTKKLSNLDFSSRVEVSGNDEIGELATNINILSDKLQHSIQKLRDSIIIEKESRERQVQLYASMSHELKTPITILKGTLEGIKDQVGPYKNPLNYVDSMIEEVHNMENIVLNLLNYSKFSVNDIKLNFETIKISDLINSEISRLKYLIDEKEIILEENIVDDIVEVDISSISMVFKNVIENAIFYSKKGSKVEIFTSSFSEYVLIQVYNHGTNIAQESLIHIFDPFYRGDDSRIEYKNGTGLGLTIVKQILEQHNSNFSLYNINNDEEVSVCFEFTLRKAKKQDKK